MAAACDACRPRSEKRKRLTLNVVSDLALGKDASTKVTAANLVTAASSMGRDRAEDGEASSEGKEHGVEQGWGNDWRRCAVLVGENQIEFSFPSSSR